MISEVRKLVEGRSQVKAAFQGKGNDQPAKLGSSWVGSSKLRIRFGNMKVIGDLDEKSLRRIIGTNHS